MSKKETEFDRYERMKKLEREAEVEKRKLSSDEDEGKKSGKPKMMKAPKKQNWSKTYALTTGEDDFYGDDE